MSRRAVAPVVGVVVLVLITLLLATVVGAMAFGVGTSSQPSDAPTAAITAEMEHGDTYGNPKLVLTHRAGDALDIHDLTIELFVDGEPLRYQPELPATAGMKGFSGIPSGPFHEKKNNIWTAGEVASITIAGTNSPQPTAGSRVTVRIYMNGKQVTKVLTTA